MTNNVVEKEVRRETGEGTDLWRVLTPPIVWAGHFLFIYVWGAVHCAKAGRAADLGPTQTAVLAATAVALAFIGLVALGLWRVRGRSLTDDDFEFEHNTPEERHRFLSHVSLMLCVLSAVGVIYGTIPVLVLENCR